MNSRYRILHYKAAWRDKKYTDNAIAIGTKLVYAWNPKLWFMPWYSHTEVWVPDKNGKFFEVTKESWTESVAVASETHTTFTIKIHPAEYQHLGTCYTSTMGQIRNKVRFAVSGMRKAPASEILRHPERWDYTEFECSDRLFELAMDFANNAVRLNKGYAKRDLWKFVPIARHFVDPDFERWYCNEFAEAFAFTAGNLKERKAGCPLTLASRMERRSLI